MSMLKSYFKGWTFRTTHPILQSGSTINVFITEYDSEEAVGVAFIGDTRLYIKGAQPEHVGKRVRVDIEEFQPDESVGYGEFVEVVGESSYAG